MNSARRNGFHSLLPKRLLLRRSSSCCFSPGTPPPSTLRNCGVHTLSAPSAWQGARVHLASVRRQLPRRAHVLAAARATIPEGRATLRAGSGTTSNLRGRAAARRAFGVTVRPRGTWPGALRRARLLQQAHFAGANAHDGEDGGADASLLKSRARRGQAGARRRVLSSRATKWR